MSDEKPGACECGASERESECARTAERTVESTDESANGIFASVVSAPKRAALLLIMFYRKCISPLFPPSCRYYPTCSQYALTAFERFGFRRGLWLTIKRISRCHPFHSGGYDPVPERYEQVK